MFKDETLLLSKGENSEIETMILWCLITFNVRTNEPNSTKPTTGHFRMQDVFDALATISHGLSYETMTFLSLLK